MELFLRLLGPPELRLGGVPASRPAPTALLLLAFVATQEQGATRGEAVGILWPDMDERKARHNLSQLLYRNRSAPWSAGLDAGATRLTWRGQSDVAAFRRAVAEGEWAKAAASYGGEFLRAIESSGRGAAGAWLETEREELRGAWREATLRHADTLSDSGRHGEATLFLQRLLNDDPLAEDVLQAFMLQSALAGRRAAALEAYESFVRRAHQELDLKPLPATDVVARSLRAERSDAQPTPVDSVCGPGGAPIPIEPTPLVGREIEAAELAGAFGDRRLRLLTLVGPGGVGKTRLASLVARGEEERFRDGVVYLPAASLTSEAELITELTAALGTAQVGPNAEERLLAAVRDRELLIVLDDYEHLLPATGAIEAVLAGAPNVSVLVTSREPLGLRTEWSYQVTELRVPPSGQDDRLHLYSAAQLFLACARRADSTFVLREEHKPAIGRICRALDGLPLGIELAARWIRLLSPAELAEALEREPDLLEDTHAERPARHQSLRAVFAHSWSRLESEQRLALARLAVFRGGFDVEAALEVTGASLKTLLTLSHKSLLARRRDGRFELPESIRRFVEQALDAEAPDAHVTRGRHARRCMRLAQRAAPRMRGSEQVAWMDVLTDEQANLRAALRWSIENDDAETGLRTASALQMFWWTRGTYGEGVAALEALLALPSAAHVSRVLRGTALHRMGTLQQERGRYPQAQAAYEAALAAGEAADDRRLAADAHHSLGLLASIRGDLDGAAARYERSLALQRASGDEWGSSVTLNNIGVALMQRGRFADARAPLEAGLRLKRKLGETQGIAYALNNLASVHHALGDLPAAGRLAQQSLDLKRRLGDEQGVATSLANLGRVAGDEGDLAEARRCFAASVERLAALRHEWRLAWLLTAVIEVEGRAGRADHALRLAGGLAALCEQLDVTLTEPGLSELRRGVDAARGRTGDDRAATLQLEGRSLGADDLIAWIASSGDGAPPSVMRSVIPR